MKQKHTSKKEDAVSPIVGVMLMLVATIIVAAVVAAFAGGIAGDTEASPNIVISGTYSQTSGLALKHVSGDSIS
ncbi:MAG: type IV pilin N-terminal domain-containing protein, partial [Methanocorpusculum sp.]|nr:type IV pilin N-terminal domain-containing protein [Methanocorpusculum sp.]